MPTGYSRTQIVLHWIVVALVALQFVLSDGMSDAFERVEEGGAAEMTALAGLHVFGGFMVFALMLVRLQLRLSRGAPPPPEAEPAPLQMAGRAAHWAFYGLLVALPVSGAVAWFRASEAAADVHEVLRAILLALIALHVAAALLHHFVLKTDVLTRMIRARD